MKMKNFYIGVLAYFLIILNSCSTITERKDNYVPMEKSCILTVADRHIREVNRSRTYFSDTVYIVPSGQYNFKGTQVLYHATGTANVTYDRGTYREVVQQTTYRAEVINDITGTADLEPGKRYRAYFARIRITPTEIDGYYSGDDGNHYFLDDDEVIYWEKDKPKIWYIWRIAVKETKGRELGKTHIAKDIGPSFNVGIRYPNTLGVEIGETIGLVLFSDPINARIYAEAGFGFGFGVYNYQFADFKNRYFFGTPLLHFGLTSDFEIGKLNMGLGAGYQMMISADWDEYEWGSQNSPYIQLTVGKPRDGAFTFDFYPGVAPLYSAFGAGFKFRL
jgi:hypothetical protein